jgi:fumarate hydratase class II
MQIITANSLEVGLAVFQTVSGWSANVNKAEVLESKEAVAAALERAKIDAERNLVVEPYAIDVTRNGAAIVPTRLRERIRAEGPTTGNSKTSAAATREEAA